MQHTPMAKTNKERERHKERRNRKRYEKRLQEAAMQRKGEKE